MIRALVVYSHPRPESFNAAIRDVIMTHLEQAGAEARLVDLYADDFDPRLSAQGLAFIEDQSLNQKGAETYCDALMWCNTLIFVYPTWWYGLPAMLKGWLDRVMVSGVAFHLPLPEGGDIRPNLTHIKRFGVYTTCGASWRLTRFIGAPGRRTLLRGVRLLCNRRCRTSFSAHYLMDSSTQKSREKHLKRVQVKVDRLIRT